VLNTFRTTGFLEAMVMISQLFKRVLAVLMFSVVCQQSVAAPEEADGYSREERAEKALIVELQKMALDPIRGITGVITAVNFDGPRASIDGRVYRFSPAAQVNLLSGWGAPTQLKPGMAVRALYESSTFESPARVIHRIDEIESAEVLVF
jgi:hypothetical protein